MSVFSKFLSKHANDLRNIGDVVGTLFRAIPMSREDQALVQTALDTIGSAAGNIDRSIRAVEKATDVKVSKADVEAAVKKTLADILPGLVGEVVKGHLDALTAPPETPAS